MTSRKSNSVTSKIPPLDDLEGRFSFIADDLLRRNIAITLQYIIFLAAIIDEERADDSTVSSSMYKDMILYTASIVEGCLHYCLGQYIAAGEVEKGKVLPGDWGITDCKILHAVSPTERVVGATQTKKPEQLTRNTQFVVINRASQRAKILNKELFAKAENLREWRNAIHLQGLRAIDDHYTKEDAQQAFEYTRILIERIEEKLNTLGKEV